MDYRFPTIGLAALLVAGCSSGPSGLNVNQAIRATEGATEDLVAQVEAAAAGSAERPLVAFAGVDNESGWEVGRIDRHAEETVESALLRTGLVRLVDDRAVEVALSDAGVRRVNDLYLPAKREHVFARLGENNVRPRYLLWGVFTSIDDMSGSRQDSRHSFTLELAGVETGEILMKAKEDVGR